ncbi:hypothetical protein PHMEG_00015445 [Phytophthora megakarya]|uniref:Uncharacterized protein n=1 Tax=Phytophthora megakarya TaxID=4795 RepID=A0A225W2U5_9STRA|nr:hypothetical protein PHMEG_00015445 [Phytophthora megakarya]
MKCLDKAGKCGHWDVVRWFYQRINDYVSSSECQTADYDDDGYYRELGDCAFYQCNLEQYKWALTNYFELSNYFSVDKWDLSERQDMWAVVRYALNDAHGNN